MTPDTAFDYFPRDGSYQDPGQERCPACPPWSVRSQRDPSLFGQATCRVEVITRET